MTAPVELPLYGKVKLFHTSKEELLQLWHRVIAKNSLDIREQKKVEEISANDDQGFQVKCSDGEILETQSVLIAIGRRGSPRKLDVPGENLPHVAYRLLDEESITGKNVLVVGGGDSAIESALLLMNQNTVTLSYRKGSFTRLKRENKSKILSALEDGFINILWETTVTKITEDSVLIFHSLDNRESQLPIDLVYIFVGGELPTEFLRKSGITITKRFGYVVKKHK